MPRIATRLALALFLLLPLVLPAAAAEEDLAALYKAARAAEDARDFKTALAGYSKIMDIDEEYEDTFERWDSCQSLAEWQEALTGEITAADLVALGEVLLVAGRFEDERKAYEDAIALDPDNADAHGHLALSHYASPVKGSMITVIKETEALLEKSPNHERLTGVLADFEIYGELRIMPLVLKDRLAGANQALKADDKAKAAGLFEKLATEEMPDAYRTKLYTEAGKLRMSLGDTEGAKKSFSNAVKHAACVATIEARLGLASIAVKDGDLEGALADLRAAVAEGSDACTLIARQRGRAFEALFNAEDAAIREEMEKLADKEQGDAPFREQIKAALAKAVKEDKLVLLHAYGPYCPYVMAMEERFADPRVQKVLDEKFVHVRLDLGSHHRGDTINEEYGDFVTRNGVPTFLILTAEGSTHSVEKDTTLMGADHRAYDVEKILAWLNQAAAD